MQQEYVYKNSGGSITIWIQNKRIIIAKLQGYISEELPKLSIAKTAELADEIKKKGLKPLILVDALEVTGQSSGARLEARQIGKIEATKLAVCARNPALTLIIKTIFQFYKSKQKIKMFKTQRAALRWLLGAKEQDTAVRRSNVFSASMIIAIALGSLIGWAIDYRIFTEYVPKLLIMNPVVALTFIALAAVLIIYSLWPLRLSKILMGALSGWLFVYGFFVWLRLVFGIDVHIDSWLFSQWMAGETLTSPRTAVNFGLIAVMLWSILTGQNKTWQRYTYYIPALLVFINSFAVAFGYFFGFSTEMFSPYVPMPLTTALLFILVVRMARSLTKPLAPFERAINLGVKYWQPAIVLIVVIAFTGLVWQQSKADLKGRIDGAVSEEFKKQQNVFSDRIASYSSLLYGFRSLFEASSSVEPDEFTAYFTASNIATSYPGLNGLAYLKAVPASQKQIYQNQMRQQATALNPQLSTFTVHPDSAQPISYIINYIEPDKSNVKQSLGFDLSSDAQRLQTLNTAKDTGSTATTGTININAAVQGNAPDKPGFFITAPIYDNWTALGEPKTVAERQNRLTGFINASFVYDETFADIFKNAPPSGVQYKIIDIATNETLYTYNANAKDIQSSVAYESSVLIGGRVWQLLMYTTPNFGTTGLERILPNAVLITGVLFSILGALLALSLARRQKAAMILANSMTEDLSNERNAAIIARNKNDAILASIGDAVFAIDATGKITLFNHATEEISGYSAEEALGKPYKDILRFVFEDSKHEVTFVNRALKGHLTHMHNHTFLIRKDGKKVAVADSAAPLRDEHGNIDGAIIVFRDVTREAELSNAKDEFVSLASHQLRTPLSAINWYIELLESGDAGKLSPQQLEYLQQISDGNQRMITLVNALLDVSRIDLGKFINEPEQISIKKIVSNLLKESEPAITAKKLAVTTDIKSDVPQITIDPKLLVIIIQNLLTNAIKYSGSKSKIAISVRRACSADHPISKRATSKECVLISVSDSGFGIPKVQQSRIFEKLFRADNARTRDVEGNGLGLYLVQQIIKRLGGAIWFDSVENQGTTFYVSLPLITKPSSVNVTKESNV